MNEKKQNDKKERIPLHFDWLRMGLGVLVLTVLLIFFFGEINGFFAEKQAELIEDSKKAVRQGATLDDAYFEELFGKVSAQKHLDQIQVKTPSGEDGDLRQDFGPLPTESVVLLSLLGGAWVLIGIYALSGWLKRKKIAKNH